MAKNKGLPKKYAKMGFGPGWKAYKKAQASASRKRKSTTKKVVKKKSTVAKKSNPGGRKTTKYTNIGIMQVAAGINALEKTGVIDGAQMALAGDFRGAAQHVAAQAGDIDTMIDIAIPPVIFGIAKKVIGPVNLFKFGRYKLNVF